MLQGLIRSKFTLGPNTVLPDLGASVSVLRGAISRIDYYFAGSLARRWLWTVIAFATGFYAANTVSLSFGALSINDVVAAAVTVLIVELSSYLYHSSSKKTLRLVFLNAFKWGICFALITDALKLAG
ncbi:hypothetical protein WJX74_010030 [Apatococcus lobatus]|uniref:DUF565 domain-containing protein n=1 Tax=Apatococcus lobatus TaxID=904363 RepID=A0AAW1QH24_9CHLO